MKALIFDVDDTLYDLATPFFRACKEIISNVDDKTLEKIFISSRNYSDIYLEQYFEGKISKSEMFKYRNRNAFEEHNIQVSDSDLETLEILYRKFQKEIDISKTIKNMLDELDDKWILGIISNGQIIHQMNKIKTLGLEKYFPEKNIFITEALGVSKPHKEAFQKALKYMNLDPKDCYYIGDSYINDILGSKEVGMVPIWYNHREYENDNSDIMTVYSEKELSNLILSL